MGFVLALQDKSNLTPESQKCLKQELIATVRQVIGPIATPDAIHWAPRLPKTRSGKIMRRVLRKIAAWYALLVEPLLLSASSPHWYMLVTFVLGAVSQAVSSMGPQASHGRVL